MPATPTTRIGRRAFLQGGSLLLAAGAADILAAGEVAAGELTGAGQPRVRVGVLTDMHHADKPPAGSRYYRQSIGKLAEAAGKSRQAKPDLVVELGDLIDAADSVDTELGYLETVNREYSALSDDRHYVLGNHCVDTLTKEEFLGAVGQEKSYYSFDRPFRSTSEAAPAGDGAAVDDGAAQAVHFVVLDSCFRADGQPYQRKNFDWTDPNIPPAELEWLAADLAATEHPVVVFAHQRIDPADVHSVKNHAAVRRVLEDSGKVLAVLQGHSHQNAHAEIAGIHYTTLAAVIEGAGAENNAYSLLDIAPTGAVRLTGFRRQAGYEWDG